jgi:hypothetical protein
MYLFYIPLMFTDVKLMFYIANIVDKQVYILVPYCNITVSTVDKISVYFFSEDSFNPFQYSEAENFISSSANSSMHLLNYCV